MPSIEEDLAATLEAKADELHEHAEPNRQMRSRLGSRGGRGLSSSDNDILRPFTLVTVVRWFEELSRHGAVLLLLRPHPTIADYTKLMLHTTPTTAY